MKLYISISANIISSNTVSGRDDPPIRIDTGTDGALPPRWAHEVLLRGPSRLIYDRGQAIIKSGARMVLEAEDGTVEVVR